MECLKRFLREEEGVTAIEYALIAGLIAVATITAVTAVGTALSGKFNTISTDVTNAGGGGGGGGF